MSRKLRGRLFLSAAPILLLLLLCLWLSFLFLFLDQRSRNCERRAVTMPAPPWPSGLLHWLAIITVIVTEPIHLLYQWTPHPLLSYRNKKKERRFSKENSGGRESIGVVDEWAQSVLVRRRQNTHTHTHTHIYICIYMYS